VSTVEIVELDESRVDVLARFFAALPEGDLTFVKEDVGGPDAIRSWMRSDRQWIARDDAARVAGFVAVLPLRGWSDHVGEIRLVVHPDHRGHGVGHALARHALVSALRLGLTKVVVEVVADQQALLTMFDGLGFTGEALLRDHIRDRSGTLRDLVLLAHHVDDTWTAMHSIGLDDELPGP
jgi:ribosomal protein S18 acetylase RimI-like enzyme